jgi:hypothetical protein
VVSGSVGASPGPGGGLLDDSRRAAGLAAGHLPPIRDSHPELRKRPPLRNPKAKYSGRYEPAAGVWRSQQARSACCTAGAITRTAGIGVPAYFAASAGPAAPPYLAAQGEAGAAEVLRACLRILLIACFRQAWRSGIRPGIDDRTPAVAWLERLRRHIDAHFNRTFKRALGHPPTAFRRPAVARGRT